MLYMVALSPCGDKHPASCAGAPRLFGHISVRTIATAMTDLHDALTAIDIALELDAAMTSRAFAANVAVRENFPQGFALDATHHAHITLPQRFVRTVDLPDIFAATKQCWRRKGTPTGS